MVGPGSGVTTDTAFQQSQAQAEFGGHENDGPAFYDDNAFGGFDDDGNDDADQIDYPTTLNLPLENINSVEYGDQLVDGHVRVKPTPLIFSKTAKRVDVQKLKENLWSKIDEEEVIWFN